MDLSGYLEDYEKASARGKLSLPDIKYFMKTFYKLEMALSNARDDNINIPPIQWMDSNGRVKKNSNPLVLCRTLSRKLTQQEEIKKQEERSKNTLEKNFEKTAREGLKHIPIPNLKTTGPEANVVLWVETVRRKYGEVKKHAPGATPSFIDTVKLSLGDKSRELVCVNTFA